MQTIRSLILGLGNPILGDDAVGIEVVRKLKERLNNKVDIVEVSVGGLSLLDIIRGYEEVIIIDSIKTEKGMVGDLYKLTPEKFKETFHLSSPHNVNFATALEIGKRLNFKMPTKIHIYAIEIEDNTNFQEELTPSLKMRLPQIIQRIFNDLKDTRRMNLLSCGVKEKGVGSYEI